MKMNKSLISTSSHIPPDVHRSVSTCTISKAEAAGAKKNVASSLGCGRSNVSTMARQLSESASRDAPRDGMSHKMLSSQAAVIVDHIVGSTYSANKTKHDAEVPETDDPALLERARCATDFVNGKSSNPFAGMSQDQLALIAYDEGGAFTVNERNAAWSEAYSQEEAWRRDAVQRAMDEYNRTGKLTNFFTEVLNHYERLPAIEKARYPENYASQLRKRIGQDFNFMTHRNKGVSNAGSLPLEGTSCSP
ncbi:hypothetical protein [Luteibacter sp.]|jgi:hypothetical protein|uniref:hypothetical protein n=1 Tax=Luteibacter sp. TaxID=1886636 RepID=UPI002F3E7451